MLQRPSPQSAEDTEWALVDASSIFSAKNAWEHALLGMTTRLMIERESGVRVGTVQDYLEEQGLSELVSLDPLSQSKIIEMLSATAHLTVKRGVIQYDPHALRTVHDSAERRLHLLRVLRNERRRPAEESSIPPEHLRDEIRDLMFRCIEKTDVDLRGRCVSLTDEDRVCSHVLLHLALGERKRFLGLLALVSAGTDRSKKDLHEALTHVVADVPKKPDPLFRTAMELGFIEKQSNGLHVAELFDETVAHGIATARETILGLRRGVLAPRRPPTRRIRTRPLQEQPAREPDVVETAVKEETAPSDEVSVMDRVEVSEVHPANVESSPQPEITPAPPEPPSYDPVRDNPAFYRLWSEKYGPEEAAVMLRRATGAESEAQEPAVIEETQPPVVIPEKPLPVPPVETMDIAEAWSTISAVPTVPVAEQSPPETISTPSHVQSFGPFSGNEKLYQALCKRFGDEEAASMLRRAAYCTRNTVAGTRTPSFIFLSKGREIYDSTWEYFEGSYGIKAMLRDGGVEGAVQRNGGISCSQRAAPYSQPCELELEKNSKHEIASDALAQETRALPGSEEKKEELDRRRRLGLPLWNNEDRLYYDDKE